MIRHVIYSHTDYLEILKIQTDYVSPIENKTLLINKNNFDLSEIYEKYQNVIFYDDSLPYASRLLSLSSLNDDFILFIHDIDILINENTEIIENLYKYAKSNNIDRIDLQYFDSSWNPNSKFIPFEIPENNFGLIQQDNPSGYIYNVNPSIWKLSVLLEIMNTFKDRNYRNIEDFSTQIYCQKFKIFKLFSENYINCGYFKCLPFFTFLHITHGGGFIPTSNNGLPNEIQILYNNIIEKYLKNSNRHFRVSMH